MVPSAADATTEEEGLEAAASERAGKRGTYPATGSTELDRARLRLRTHQANAQPGPNLGVVFCTLPFTLSTTLDAPTFRILLRRRLAADLMPGIPPNERCPAITTRPDANGLHQPCSTPAGVNGLHVTSCFFGGLNKMQHDSYVNDLASLARHTGHITAVEQTNIGALGSGAITTDFSASRSDIHGRDTFDVTVCHLTTPSSLANAAATIASLMAEREAAKLRHYATANLSVRASDVTILTFNDFGGCTDSTRKRVNAFTKTADFGAGTSLGDHYEMHIVGGQPHQQRSNIYWQTLMFSFARVLGKTFSIASRRFYDRRQSATTNITTDHTTQPLFDEEVSAWGVV